jgi:hypothetical protein
MAGISLVTKGFISPVGSGSGSGSGGAGFVRPQEELPKPFIKVTDVTIKANDRPSITEDTFKVKSLKIIVDQKD